MSRIEHYFENLLEYGKDVEGEPNKSQLSPEVVEAIEECADYVIHHHILSRLMIKIEKEIDIIENTPTTGEYIARQQVFEILDKYIK